MFVMILLSILAADFLTGLVHWFEDTYGLPSWPVLGKAVIVDNIKHHKHPSLIGSMGSLIYRNYQPMVAAMVTWLALWSVGWDYWPLVLTAFVAGCGNEIHTWTHRRSRSKIVRFLQKTRIVHTPQQHAKHHKPPYDSYFCTVTNIVNPVLEAVHFWRAVEWLIAVVLRVQPKRMTARRDYV